MGFADEPLFQQAYTIPQQPQSMAAAIQRDISDLKAKVEKLSKLTAAQEERLSVQDSRLSAQEKSVTDRLVTQEQRLAAQEQRICPGATYGQPRAAGSRTGTACGQ